MLFPHVHCTEDLQICQVTTGESEINAAATITALVLSDKFDLTSTYFMIGGIAGVSPKWSTLGGIALSRYAVQVALQYEFDAREMPGNFTTGYVGYGTLLPDMMPETWCSALGGNVFYFWIYFLLKTIRRGEVVVHCKYTIISPLRSYCNT